MPENVSTSWIYAQNRPCDSSFEVHPRIYEKVDSYELFIGRPFIYEDGYLTLAARGGVVNV